ncbi:MAG: hypothetical protein AB200_01960 [Parcubacteria bacterium C7867-005]|nr:MAG: hypothetical protein AB200_01960 [Parcubacteria bacterium C7867-005]
MATTPPRVRGKIFWATKPKETAMNWTTKDWTQGELNALVKKIGGGQVARGILDDTVKFTVTEMPAPYYHEFFQTRSDLFIYDGFRDLVLAKVGKGEQAKPIVSKSVALPRDMTDKEIEEMLGNGHIFTEVEVCAVIQKLITEQEGGKEGELLNNGFANLFYTSSCVVVVRWLADVGRWNVGTWRRDVIGWSAGDRAFSR